MVGGNPSFDHEEPNSDVPMTVTEHLAEFRHRLIISLLAMLPGAALGWVYAPELLNLMLLPYSAAFRKLDLGEPAIHFANPMDQLVAYLKLALVAGLLGGIPVIAWQVWAFVSPGLYEQEKRYAVPFSMATTLCFCGGALFGFEVVFPMAFETLLALTGSIGSVTVQPTIMIGEYLSFATRMLLAFGAVFEVPVVVTALAFAQIVNYRQLLDFGRWWVLISAVLSALLTPPDIGSQMIMIVPLVVLYYLSVIIAYLVGPKPDADKSDGADDDKKAPLGKR